MLHASIPAAAAQYWAKLRRAVSLTHEHAMMPRHVECTPCFLGDEAKDGPRHRALPELDHSTGECARCGRFTRVGVTVLG